MGNEAYLYEVRGDDGSRVYLEVSRAAGVSEQKVMVAGVKEKALETFGELGDYISARAGELLERVKQAGATVKPSRIAVSFAVGVNGETGIPFVAKGGVEACLTVTVEWTQA